MVKKPQKSNTTMVELSTVSLCNISKYLALKFSSATILFVAALPVSAETVSSVGRDAISPIDEVMVTVKRRATSMHDVSAAVSLVSQEQLLQQKLTTDVLLEKTGVFLQQTTPGQGAAIVRGVKGSAVLHLVDGIRLNNAIFRSAPTQYLALVPSSGLQRVEVIRGTQTSLYGSDAIGGVVQLVTRVPEFTSEQYETRADAFVGLGSAEQERLLKLTVDAGSNRYAASFSAEYQNNGDRQVGGGERIKPSAFDAAGARLMLAATPSDLESWMLDIHYLEQPETPRVDELVAGYGQLEPSSSEYAFAPNKRSFVHLRRTRTSAGLGVDWNFDLAWQQIVDDRITRDFESPLRIQESNHSDLYAATLSAAGTVGAIDWIAGAEFYFDRVSSARTATDIDTEQTTDVAPRFPDNSSMQQIGIYGRAEHRLNDRHLLSLGLRYSDIEVDLGISKVPVSDLSGDFGWIFDLDDRLQLIANVGFGFRAPNVFDLGALGNRPGNRFSIPNQSLGSEHVLQGDFGVRLLSSDWNAEVVAFSMHYYDRITTVLTGATTPSGRDIVQSVNGAESSIYGIEADISHAWSERLSTRLMLNYTHGTQRIEGGADEPADRIPPVNGRLFFSYEAAQGFSFDSWIHFAGAQSRLSARDIRDVRIDPNGTAGWGVVGARATWRRPSGLEISTGVENLLDNRYRLHGSGIDSIGRNFFLSLRRIWD